MFWFFFWLGCVWFAVGSIIPVLGYPLGLLCWAVAGCSLIYEGK